MNAHMTPEQVLDYTMRAVRGQARYLIATRAFPADERQDVEQALLLEVTRRLPRFHSSRGVLKLFIATAVWQAGVSLRKKRWAAKRNPGPLALSAFVNDQSIEDVVDLRQSGASVELAIDVRRSLASVPSKLQEMAQSLPESSPYEVALELGIAPATAYRRRRQLQEHFRRTGLDRYVMRGRGHR